jgi:hypothetical protein
MAQAVVRQRVDSPERWAKAFERATQLGLEVFTIAGEDTFVVTSASKMDTVYRVTTTTCGCHAGLSGDPVCCHRAVVRFVQGHLVTEPQLALVDCSHCSGCGAVYSRNGGWQCEFCQGRGQVSVTPVPAVMPAATRSAVAA